MAEVSSQIVKVRGLLRWIAVPLVPLFVAIGLAVYAFASYLFHSVVGECCIGLFF
jgi:hypothetical protein